MTKDKIDAIKEDREKAKGACGYVILAEGNVKVPEGDWLGKAVAHFTRRRRGLPSLQRLSKIRQEVEAYFADSDKQARIIHIDNS